MTWASPVETLVTLNATSGERRIGHLHDLEVVADHLVEELKLAASRGRLDDRAVLADLKGLGLAVGKQVRIVGLGLLDGVGAGVRTLVGRGLGGVCAGLAIPGGCDGLDDATGLEPLVAHEYLVLGFVGDGELDAGERGAGVEGVVGVAAHASEAWSSMSDFVTWTPPRITSSSRGCQ